MPDQPNDHVCVCGFRTRYWANLVGHRRGCDSYKEHRDKLAAARGPEPAPSEQEIAKFHCPHDECPAFSHTLPDLLKHVQYCTVISNSEQVAYEEIAWGLGDFGGELDLLVAYEFWCRENGREP